MSNFQRAMGEIGECLAYIAMAVVVATLGAFAAIGGLVVVINMLALFVSILTGA